MAGQPFPFLDPNDPQVATKIIWNNVFRPLQTDDYDLRYFACENVRSGRNVPYRVLDEIDVGHYAGYNEIGRTEVDPMPIDQDFKKTGVTGCSGSTRSWRRKVCAAPAFCAIAMPIRKIRRHMVMEYRLAQAAPSGRRHHERRSYRIGDAE